MRPRAGELGRLNDVDARVIVLRGRQVILDTSLAEVYGVPTKALNQAVRRNIGRFPEDLRFQVTRDELAEVVTNCDHLSRLRFSAVPRPRRNDGVGESLL